MDAEKSATSVTRTAATAGRTIEYEFLLHAEPVDAKAPDLPMMPIGDGPTPLMDELEAMGLYYTGVLSSRRWCGRVSAATWCEARGAPAGDAVCECGAGGAGRTALDEAKRDEAVRAARRALGESVLLIVGPLKDADATSDAVLYGDDLECERCEAARMARVTRQARALDAARSTPTTNSPASR